MNTTDLPAASEQPNYSAISPSLAAHGYPKKRREIRGVSCPKCNPKLDNPDLIRGYEGTLKYLIFEHFKCRNCGTMLVDVGPQTDVAAEAAFSDNGPNSTAALMPTILHNGAELELTAGSRSDAVSGYPRVEYVVGDAMTVSLPARHFRLVYADPPYANCRFKYARLNKSRQWGKNVRADFMRELVARMESLREPEGGVCAISMASPELRLLHLFPSGSRVLAWTKPYAPHRPHVWPTYAWEPLVVWGKMPGRAEQRASKTPHDWLNLSPKVPRKGGHETPKPDAFGEWVRNVTLGPRVGPVCELFAGTAPVARAAVAAGCPATCVDLVCWMEQTSGDNGPR